MPYSAAPRDARRADARGPGWQVTPSLRQPRQADARSRAAEHARRDRRQELDSTYEPGRRRNCWLKIKIIQRQEFVIGGWTGESTGLRDRIGTMLLGYYDCDGKLHYAGHVGTGPGRRRSRAARAAVREARAADEPVRRKTPAAAPRREQDPCTSSRNSSAKSNTAAGPRAAWFSKRRSKDCAAINRRSKWSRKCRFQRTKVSDSYGKGIFPSDLVRLDQLRAGHHPRAAVHRRAREAAALPHAARPGQGPAQAEDVLPRRREGSPSRAHRQGLRDREGPLRRRPPGRARGGRAEEARKAIEIQDFVELDEIDPLFFDRPYYVAPKPEGAKPYKLLLEAMEKTKKVGIAKVVMWNKEYLAALRPLDGALVLETMHFNDEVDPARARRRAWR